MKLSGISLVTVDIALRARVIECGERVGTCETIGLHQAADQWHKNFQECLQAGSEVGLGAGSLNEFHRAFSEARIDAIEANAPMVQEG